MKRAIAIAASLALVFLALAGCKPKVPDIEQGEGTQPVEITLCSYPVGGWSKSSVSNMLTHFHNEHPTIRVNLMTVDYITGDAEIENAIKQGKAPDVVFEGPERLLANWGARGLMANLNDLWRDSEDAAKIFGSVESACRDGKGDYYVYPVCMTTHCMAINRDLFEESGAWQYIDEETHTWSTDDFEKAVKLLAEYTGGDVAKIYCNGQSGDQGTRALVNNLFGGTFTDPQHTKYTVDSEENIHALEFLKNLEGIDFDSSLAAKDEIDKFCKGELAMAFCWNVSNEVDQARKDNFAFDIFPMAFPTQNGDPKLQGGIWGFGVFDNGDEKRIEAAKTLIRYMTKEGEGYESAVLTANFWAVRDMPNLYVNDKLMNEYGIFQKYMGDFYQVTPGWAEARTAWWEMLKEIEEGTDIREAVKTFSEKANNSQ